jgi:hypothetical protein
MENQHPQSPHCTIPIHKPRLREYAFFFASGILVSIPFASFFESLYPSTTALSSVLLIVVLAPLIEELAKVFPLFYRHGETERSIVTLGLLIGLGFGIAEFVSYVAFVGVSPIVRFPSIIFHASSAIIASYGIAKNNPVPYYLFAVFLHFVNNFFAVLNDQFSGSLGLFVVLTTFLMGWHYWHKTRKDVITV